MPNHKDTMTTREDGCVTNNGTTRDKDPTVASLERIDVMVDELIAQKRELTRQVELLREAIKGHEQWMVERGEWLRKEAHSGGNWEHLKARMDECAYVLQKLRALQPHPLVAEGEG